MTWNRLITTAEAARLIGVQRRTITRAVANRTLPVPQWRRCPHNGHAQAMLRVWDVVQHGDRLSLRRERWRRTLELERAIRNLKGV